MQICLSPLLDQDITCYPVEVQRAYHRHQQLFDEGGSATSSYISLRDRSALPSPISISGERGSLTYGEIVFAPFYRLLQMALPSPGEVFYDLGCGTGSGGFKYGLPAAQWYWH